MRREEKIRGEKRREEEDTIIENIIPNPNNLENRITNIITSYINDMNEIEEQRNIQLAIQASLNDSLS